MTSADGSGGPVRRQTYRDDVNNMPLRRLAVRNLLPVGGITTGSVEYPQQTPRTNNAAPIAEGASKPESALGWTMLTVTPKVIAHWVLASRQILDDTPQLQGLIDGELRYGLALVEETELLNGSGSGEHLQGLVTAATAFAPDFTPDSENMLDTIALALLQAALANEPADGIVMKPSDWMYMLLMKAGEGRYLLGDPSAVVEPQLFGLPVVPTQAMTADKFLVGNFRRAATLYDR